MQIVFYDGTRDPSEGSSEDPTERQWAIKPHSSCENINLIIQSTIGPSMKDFYGLIP